MHIKSILMETQRLPAPAFCPETVILVKKVCLDQEICYRAPVYLAFKIF